MTIDTYNFQYVFKNALKSHFKHFHHEELLLKIDEYYKMHIFNATSHGASYIYTFLFVN